MKNILLMSDTHGYCDNRILAHAKQADEVWHAGDIGSLAITDELKKGCSQLRAVYGNVDNASIRSEFPLHNRFICEEIAVWITHIGGYPNRYDYRVKDELKKKPPKLFICGHSHILKVMHDDKLNLLHMNPGAIGKHGFHKVRTMLKFKIEGKRIFDLSVIEYSK